MLTPKWEELAGKLKHVVKVAYVDTEGGPTPQAVGQIQGTPTIKAFIPRRTSASNAKEVVDYQQGREVADLLRFATGRMPNYVEPVASADELRAFEAKAAEWGLPRIFIFGAKAGQTSSTAKALSAEYRRRALVGDRAQRNDALVKRYGVNAFPTLICAKPDGTELRFEKKEPTYHRLETFFGKCALRKAVTKKPSATESKEEL